MTLPHPGSYRPSQHDVRTRGVQYIPSPPLFSLLALLLIFFFQGLLVLARYRSYASMTSVVPSSRGTSPHSPSPPSSPSSTTLPQGLLVLARYRSYASMTDPTYLISRNIDKVIFAFLIFSIYLFVGSKSVRPRIRTRFIRSCP